MCRVHGDSGSSCLVKQKPGFSAVCQSMDSEREKLALIQRVESFGRMGSDSQELIQVRGRKEEDEKVEHSQKSSGKTQVEFLKLHNSIPCTLEERYASLNSGFDVGSSPGEFFLSGRHCETCGNISNVTNSRLKANVGCIPGSGEHTSVPAPLGRASEEACCLMEPTPAFHGRAPRGCVVWRSLPRNWTLEGFSELAELPDLAKVPGLEEFLDKSTMSLPRIQTLAECLVASGLDSDKRPHCLVMSKKDCHV